MDYSFRRKERKDGMDHSVVDQEGMVAENKAVS
jgi:hypothetical protein